MLSVRDGDATRFRTLADLRGRRVGTLGGTIAYEILLRAEREYGIHAVSYDDDVHPYSDLVLGRVDAVLLDNVLAERRARALPGFTIQPQSVAIGHYVGVLAARERRAARSDQRDPARRDARRHARAHLSQVECLERRSAGASCASSGRRTDRRRTEALDAIGNDCRSRHGKRRCAICRRCCARRSSRSCCRACRWRWRSRSACSIASGRVYGSALARGSLTGYVELMRGTPMLLQLFVLYYGLAAADPPAGVRRGAARAWRSTTRRTRARSTAARSKRCSPASSRRRARSASASARC